MDTSYYLFAILVFAVVVFSVEGLYLWWTASRGAAAKRIERRLTSMSFEMGADPAAMSMLKSRVLSASPVLDALLRRIPGIDAFDRFLQQSGKGWTVGRFVGYTVASLAIALVLLSMLHLPPFIGPVLAVLAAGLPWQVAVRARNKRMKKFEEQLPEAADLISRALRSGHALAGALQMVGTEMPNPIAEEFRAASDEINFGVSMNQALQNLAGRMPSMDLRFFVIAVLIQRESGGNLAEILGNLSAIIRQRLALLNKVRVLSAEGKLSAWILGALPFATALLINIVNPGFMKVLWTDPVGLKLVGGALVLMVLGVLWMRKIIRIRV